MIKEKYKTPIAIISMTLCLFLVIGYIIANPNTDTQEIQQPEYIDKVFNKEKVNEIDITVNEKDWKDLLENAIEKEYIMGDITINGEKFSSVGIRAKGNSSLKMVASDDTTDRYSLKIDFHEYVKGQTYHGLEKIALNNCISDATYMKEYISYEMFSKMGIATPACSYSHIKINGKEWGLYLAVEVMEESFIERYFGSTDGNLYKPESTEAGENMGPMLKKDGERKDGKENRNPSNNMGMSSSGKGGTNLVYNGDDLSNYSGIFDNAVFNTTNKKDNKQIVEMIKNLNEGTNLEKYLDVDEVLRYFAVNTFLVNLDSYAGSLKHNYYLYEKDGISQILPWDLNLSFAGYEVRDGQSAVNFPIDKPVSDTMENSPLISKLLEVDEYKEIYHKYLKEIVTEYIESGEYEATINNIDNLIGDYVKNDPTAFYTYEEYRNSIPVLLQLGKDRAGSIIKQLKGEEPSTSYGTVNTTVDLSLLGSMGGHGGEMQGNREDGNGNMLSRETMDQAMEIIKDAEGNELTEDQKVKLKELGLTSSQIEEMANMKNRMSFGGNNKNNEQKQFKPGENMEGGRPPNNGFKQGGINKESLIVLAISIAILLIVLIFLSKFKRRKTF